MHVSKEVSSKEQIKKDLYHNDITHNKVDLSPKDNVSADVD